MGRLGSDSSRGGAKSKQGAEPPLAPLTLTTDRSVHDDVAGSSSRRAAAEGRDDKSPGLNTLTRH